MEDADARERKPDVSKTAEAYTDDMDPIVRRYLDVRSVL